MSSTFNPDDWEDITISKKNENTFNPAEWEDITNNNKRLNNQYQSFVAPFAPNPNNIGPTEKPTFIEKTKKFVNNGVKEIGDFAKIGLGINESPFQKKTNDPSFETLTAIKSLTKTDDANTWRKNTEQELTKRGYSNVRFSENGNIFATTKDGKDQEITGGFLKDAAASLIGDKFKETGALAGAAKGFNYTSKLPIPNPYLKGGAIAVGTALGAGTGALFGDGLDQAEANIKYDENINTKQSFSSAFNSANDGIKSELIGLGFGKAFTALPDAKNEIVTKAKDMIANKVYGELSNYQDPKQLIQILDLANQSGVKLVPSQLSDNKAIEQLTNVIAQNPVLSQKLNTVNKENKIAMNTSINELLDKIGINSVKLRNKDNIDPLGKDIKDSLIEAKNIRSNQVKNAYDLFENSVSGKAKITFDGFDNHMQTLREDALTMPNPDSFNNVINVMQNRAKEMFDKKGYLDVKDLNNLSKQANQIYKRNFDDSSSRSAIMMIKSYIDNDLEKMAKIEGDDVFNALSNAKDLHIQKENLYGKTSQLPFRKTIDNQALETIVDDISKSKQSITNIKALKEELKLLPNGDKILGSLARSFIDESLQKAKLTNDVYSAKEINSKELLKAFDSMDYRQLEILTDKETVDKLHNIRKLTELIMKQDKVLAGTGGGLNTMGMVRSSIVDKVADFMKIRAFGKIVTTPVTQDLLYKALKNASNNKLDEADRAIKELDTLIKEK